MFAVADLALYVAILAAPYKFKTNKQKIQKYKNKKIKK
jgi:hypothetical protein